MRATAVAALTIGTLTAAGAAGLLLRGGEPEWTTSVPAASDSLERGLEALGKIYEDDARRHLERALALDPDLVAARIFLLQLRSGEDERSRLVDALRQADRDRLRERERLLLDYHLALADRRRDEARALLARYAERHPDDSFVLRAQADDATALQDFAQAEALLRRLAHVAPNDARAYNALGYLAMARGDFAESERMFRTYVFIAPDQANPHDSLGELFIVSGRYPEAAAEFEAALALKADFCPALAHLFQLAAIDGRDADAREAAAREARECPGADPSRRACEVAAWEAIRAGEWEAIWRAGGEECAGLLNRSITRYDAALRTGRRAEADAIAARLRSEIAKLGGTAKVGRVARSAVLHLEGSRLLADGRAAEAAERLREADDLLSYRGLDEALPKLSRRLVLADALRAAGDGAEASRVAAEARAVNARLVARLEPLFR